MPRIPSYDYQTRAPGVVDTPRASGDALGAAAGGLRQVGNQVSNTAKTLAQIEERKSLWDAEITAAEAENRWTQRFEEAKRNAPPGAPGFTQQIQDEYDAWKQDAVDMATTAPARQLLDSKFTRLGGALSQQASRFEADAYASHQATRLEQSLDQFRNNARANPAQLLDTEKRAKELVYSTPFWDQQTKDKIWAKYQQGIYDSGLDGLITVYETTPVAPNVLDGMIEDLRKGWLGFKDTSSPEMFDAALTRLTKRKASLDAEGKANVSLYLQDTLTSIAVHGTDPGLLTPDGIRAAYHDDPEKADRTIKLIEDAKSYYQVRQSVALTTPAEDAANLAALKNKAYGIGATQGEQFMNDYQSALASKYRQIAEDPFTYAVQNDPSLAQSIQQSANDPEAFRSALAQADEIQARLGVPEWRRGVLGVGAAQETAQRLNAIAPEKAADELEAMANQYGSQWGKAMRELADAKLNPAFMTLARLDGPQDVSVRKNLAAALQVGRDVLRKNITVPVANSVDSKVVDNMADFAATVSYDGVTGQRVLEAETASAQALAYYYVQRGDSESDAAKNAVKHLLADRYDFVDTYRTPKDLGNKVEGMARETLWKLKPEQFAPVSGGDPNLGEDYRKRVAWSLATQQGIWLNTPDGKGVQLYIPDDSTATGYSPARLMGGDPILIDFSAARTYTPPTGNPRQVR